MFRLTREEFIALAKARGYTLTGLALVWGLKRARVSQIAKDPARKPHWDLALWGLPSKPKLARIEARRARAVAQLGLPKPPVRVVQPIPDGDVSVEVGDVWVVGDSPGDHLPEGCEGRVEALRRDGGQWQADLSFPQGGAEEAGVRQGYFETFPLSFLTDPSQRLLSATGRNALHPPAVGD